MTAIVATDEQRAIYEVARKDPYSLLVDALAGSGKTTTLIEVIKVLPQPSTLVLAFNKIIADTMLARKPAISRSRVVHVKTLHAAGWWITQSAFPHLKIDRDSSEQLIQQFSRKSTMLRVRGAALRLLRLVKDLQHAVELDLTYAHAMGIDFGMFDKLDDIQETQEALEIVNLAYKASLDVAARSTIDFPDQGWLPLVLDLPPPSRYKAILLDEAQDVNPNQIAMVERLLAPGGRILGCGDLHQQIYGWRGAVGTEVWGLLREKHKAMQLPLTITWRCDRAIVAEAQKIVPAIRERPGAGDGKVLSATEAEMLTSLANSGPEDGGSIFVLSRTNAQLLRVSLEMWRRNIPFNTTQGQEILGPLRSTLQKVCKGEAGYNMPRFLQAAAAWRTTEMMKAENAGSSSWAERIGEQYLMMLYCAKYVSRPSDIERLLGTIFAHDDMCWITLSTVHKAKGLEADRVFLLRETFPKFQDRKDPFGEPVPIPAEEDNVLYVAITRAKHELTWVSIKRD